MTGSSLQEVARRRLFGPLGMHDTTFISDADGIALSVPGHRRLSGGDFEVYQPDLVVPGVGGLVTSVSDLARWARNLQQPTVGGTELVESLTRRGVLNDGAESEQAAGLEVRDRFGYEVIEHGGSNRGFSSHFAWVRGMQLASITLCNVRQARATTLNLNVVARLLDVAPLPPSRPTLSDSRLDQLEPFAGLYESPGVAGALEIEIDRPYAVATIYGDDPGGSTAASRLLGPNGDDPRLLVHGAPVGTSLAFRRLDDGLVATLQMERTPSLTYRLVDPATFTDLQSVAGRYRSDELAAEYRLTVEGKELVARAVPDDGAPVDMGELLRLTDVFFVLSQDLLVNLRVLRRVDGSVEAIEINEPRVRGVRLNRVGATRPAEGRPS